MRCFRIFADNTNLLNQLNMLYARACTCSIGIYHSGMTAYGRKIKTGFAFFNEVFHQPSLAVKFDEILW